MSLTAREYECDSCGATFWVSGDSLTVYNCPCCSDSRVYLLRHCRIIAGEYTALHAMIAGAQQDTESVEY